MTPESVRTRTMTDARRRRNRRLLATGTAVAALALAACSSGSSSSSTTATTGAAATTTTTGAAATTTTGAATSTTSATAVQNLAVTPAVRAALTSTFVAYKNIPASYVAGTVPNSVYYAYDPTTQTSWALAEFTPSSTASQNALVGFQDGGSLGLFSMKAGQAWTVQNGFIPFPCSEVKFFPATVVAAWNLPQPTAAMQC